jgi:hypothetical protein
LKFFIRKEEVKVESKGQRTEDEKIKREFTEFTVSLLPIKAESTSVDRNSHYTKTVDMLSYSLE